MERELTENRLEKIKRVASQRQSGLILVLEDIHFPANAQAMFRTAEAFGIQKVYLIFEREKVFNPEKADKEVSVSGYKWLDFEYFDSSQKCFDQLREDGYKIAITALDEKAENLYETDISSEKIALVMGSEAKGVSEMALKSADIILTLPMLGMVQSLNVSASCAIFLYEITRQRYRDLEKYQMSNAEQKELIEKFCNRRSK